MSARWQPSPGTARASPATSRKMRSTTTISTARIRAGADIAHMMQGLFHRDAADYRWEMFDPVFDGAMGYAWSLSSFTSKIPQFEGQRVVIDGMSRVLVRDGLIAEYRESVNGGVAMAQLGVEPERMTKVFKRWTGWLKERPETVEYLARPKDSRRKLSSRESIKAITGLSKAAAPGRSRRPTSMLSMR